jgi:ABC-type multidrug transport system ATPase subunit
MIKPGGVSRPWLSKDLILSLRNDLRVNKPGDYIGMGQPICCNSVIKRFGNGKGFTEGWKGVFKGWGDKTNVISSFCLCKCPQKKILKADHIIILMSAIIEVENLSKQYGDLKAVDDLSFTVNAGDVYGFLGQNGAGKSTTIRMLLTLVRPSKGEIRIFEKPLVTHRHAILTAVGAVIEKPDLYKYLTAYENLALFARMSGIKPDRKRLEQQLETVGLLPRANSKVKTFSQGMKQRLGIAVALVHDPKLIVLDEPTNGLDPQGIADVRNLILHLSRNLGKTVLVSSHLLNEIEMIASRMLIIDRGRKVAEGSVAELFDPAKTVVELQTDNQTGALALIADGPYSSALRDHDVEKIRFTMNKKQIPELAAYLVGIGVPIHSLRAKHSLEDYFLSLTTANQHVDAFAN